MLRGLLSLRKTSKGCGGEGSKRWWGPYPSNSPSFPLHTGACMQTGAGGRAAWGQARYRVSLPACCLLLHHSLLAFIARTIAFFIA